MKKDEIKQLWLESGATLIVEWYSNKTLQWTLLTHPAFNEGHDDYRFKEGQDFSVINDKVKKAWEDSGENLIIQHSSVNGAWLDVETPLFFKEMIYRIKPGQLKDSEKINDTAYLDVHSLSALSTQVGGSHYKEMKIQPIEFCYLNKIPVIESSIIRYVCRHKNKNGLQDLEKARHFLDILIELEYKNKGA